MLSAGDGRKPDCWGIMLEEENKTFSNGHSTLVAFGGCEVGEFRI